MILRINTPRWALPLLEPARMKGAKGGRGSGKSHFFAELLIEYMIMNPDEYAVCVREVQKSLKFSAKKLIEDKITSLGVGHLFEVTQTEIRCRQGQGLIIFQGLMDHTADSIKSLEGFKIAWVEEAQSLSKRSLDMLIPTIRSNGSQIWFSWNPDKETDPVEQQLDRMLHVHVNYLENPHCPQELIDEAEIMRQRDPDAYQHVWLGGHNTKSDSQVFNGKWKIDEFEPASDWTPLYGMDFGFSQDPTTANECYLEDEVLYIYREAGKVGLELDDTAAFIKSKIPTIDQYTVRADSARPESISHLQRHGLPKITGVEKWTNSVEEGVRFIRGLKGVVIHPSCKETIQEFRLYSHKIDKRTGDILPDIIDKHNHYIDAIRYALQPLIQKKDFIFY
jgi:phage terminase large subunit